MLLEKIIDVAWDAAKTLIENPPTPYDSSIIRCSYCQAEFRVKNQTRYTKKVKELSGDLFAMCSDCIKEQHPQEDLKYLYEEGTE